jgi:hypothetical protein
MSFKDVIESATENLKAGAENIKDSVSAAAHRTNANAEQASRDLAGDDMTTGQKAQSMWRQGTETVKAGVDEAKIGGLKADVAVNDAKIKANT